MGNTIILESTEEKNNYETDIKLFKKILINQKNLSR